MTVTATESWMKVIKIALIKIIDAVAKDGFQPTDIGAFLASSEFQAAVSAAIPEASSLPGEVLNLSLVDDLQLARDLYSCVTDVMTEIRLLKNPAA